MKFYEALRLMQEGEQKIRLPDWQTDHYIEFVKYHKRIFHCASNKIIYLWLPNQNEILSNEWEIYEQ